MSDCITIADSTRSCALKGCSRATMALKCLQFSPTGKLAHISRSASSYTPRLDAPGMRYKALGILRSMSAAVVQAKKNTCANTTGSFVACTFTMREKNGRA